MIETKIRSVGVDRLYKRAVVSQYVHRTTTTTTPLESELAKPNMTETKRGHVGLLVFSLKK